MKNQKFVNKNLIAHVITRPSSSRLPKPTLIIMYKHFRDLLPLCDYVICERSLSCFVDNFLIT